jgi:sentrin-specific protease 7
LNPQDIRKILIYPQGKGGISIINTEDYMCLAIDQYLNDVIIDFYLNYLRLEVLKELQKEKTHVFSTFFYKRLTTVPRQKAVQGDPKLTGAQKRHERVKNWTKHVNLFDKEFIIILINEQSHWFLAIICYPGLKGPVTYDTGAKVKTPLPIIKKKRKCQMYRNDYWSILIRFVYSFQKTNVATNWKHHHNTGFKARSTKHTRFDQSE